MDLLQQTMNEAFPESQPPSVGRTALRPENFFALRLKGWWKIKGYEVTGSLTPVPPLFSVDFNRDGNYANEVRIFLYNTCLLFLKRHRDSFMKIVVYRIHMVILEEGDRGG